MAIVKCGKGHFYDDAKYDSCPMCLGNKGGGSDDMKTMALFSKRGGSPDDEKTIGVNFKKTNREPVAGWLVCIAGDDKGRDFRIHSGKNFIGRDISSDIYLENDPTISRKKVGSIIYDPKSNEFIIVNDEGISISVNNEVILSPKKLKDYDNIKIGSYEFELIAYCKGDKKW